MALQRCPAIVSCLGGGTDPRVNEWSLDRGVTIPDFYLSMGSGEGTDAALKAVNLVQGYRRRSHARRICHDVTPLAVNSRSI